MNKEMKEEILFSGNNFVICFAQAKWISEELESC